MTEPKEQTNSMVQNADHDIELTFKDEQKSLYATKKVLSGKSDVFNVMFNGPLATLNAKIQIEMCTHDEFSEVLRYFHTDEIELNENNVKGIFAAAHYYNISGLEEKCNAFEIQYLNIENVCEVYAFYYQFENKLKRECLNIFDNWMPQIIHKSNFLDLSKAALESLLQREDIYVTEFDLFNAVQKWVYSSADRSESFEKNMDIFRLIRFPTMTHSEFSECCKNATNILTKEDIDDILIYIENRLAIPTLKFSAVKRKGIGNDIIFTKVATKVCFINNNETINFIVTNDLKIKRFDFICQEKCRCRNPRGALNYGFELSASNGQSIYRLEQPNPTIDCLQLILKPQIEYKLETWLSGNDFVQHNSCTYKSAILLSDDSSISSVYGPFSIFHKKSIFYFGKPEVGTYISKIKYQTFN